MVCPRRGMATSVGVPSAIGVVSAFGRGRFNRNAARRDWAQEHRWSLPPRSACRSTTHSFHTATPRISRSRLRCRASCRSSASRGTGGAPCASSVTTPGSRRRRALADDREGLGQSRYLVICLPRRSSRASKWCGMEVAHWLEDKGLDTHPDRAHRGRARLGRSGGRFPSGTRRRRCRRRSRGSSATSRNGSTCGRSATRPTRAILRFMDAAADLAAAVHGMPKEDLLSQEVRQQKRALRSPGRRRRRSPSWPASPAGSGVRRSSSSASRRRSATAPSSRSPPRPRPPTHW